VFSICRLYYNFYWAYNQHLLGIFGFSFIGVALCSKELFARRKIIKYLLLGTAAAEDSLVARCAKRQPREEA
jgi:hypothetical protein